MRLTQVEATVDNFTHKHQTADIQATQRLLDGQEYFYSVTPIETAYVHMLHRLSKRRKQNFRKIRL